MSPPAPARHGGRSRALRPSLLALLLSFSSLQRVKGVFTCGSMDATCTALGALYSATGGASWTNNGGWAAAAAGTATPYCSFYNVNCGSGPSAGLVVSIALTSNGLTGTLPAEMASLTALTALALSGNSLSGTVPSALLTLAPLQAQLVLYPQSGGAVLEASSLNVNTLTDISTAVSNPASLVTTFVLQQHISAAGQQGITVPSTRTAPVVIAGNTAACLLSPHDTPSPPPPPPPPTQPPGGGPGPGPGPPGSPGSSAPSPTGRQWWQYVAQYSLCTIDMGGYGAISAHFKLQAAVPLVLRGVSLVGGGGSLGGAVFVNSSSGTLVLSGATLAHNAASVNGGAVYSLGNVTATGSTISYNTAAASAGAIYLDASSPTPGQPPSAGVVSLSNCTVSSNYASTQHGGLVVMGDTNSLVASSTSFSLNSAVMGSGAVYVAGGAATLSSCVLESNTVTDTSPLANTVTQVGAALYVKNADATLSGCTLRNNSVGGFGGAVMAEDAVLVISASTLTNNSAGYQGGAIYAAGSTTTLTGVTLADNTGQAAGAFGMSGGSVRMTNAVVANNTASSSSSQGGCMFADDDKADYDAPAIVLTNTTFSGCSVATVRPTLDTPGVSYVTAYGAGSGGGIYLLGQRSAPAQVLLSGGTRFVGNNATSGAGIFAYGSVALSIADSTFASNAATDMGGALYVQSAAPATSRRRLLTNTTVLVVTVSITGSSFAGNSAASGAVAVMNSGTTFTASGSAFTGNTATNGAVLMLRVLDQPGLAPVVSLSGINATGNAAFSGAFAYHDSATALALPACTGCVLSNTQSNSGAAPASFNASLALLVAASGRTLPAFNVTLYDVNGAVVSSWPDLVITVSPGNFTGLSGTTTAAYSNGAALFNALSISDVENASHVLTYTLSTTLAALNGATGTVTAAVAPCAANEVFDFGTLRCKCSMGTYTVGTTCVACARGLVATSAGAIACEACLAREAWVNASTCVACPSNSGTSPYDATRCGCDYGYYDTLFGASATEPVCAVCPTGGSCTTGFVGAAEGYWRESLLSDVFYSCRTGNCLQEDVTGPLSLPVSGSSAWVYLGGNQTEFNATGAVTGANGTAPQNCADGNGGPLCALCLPGYAMQSGVCAACDPADAFDAWHPRNKSGLLVGCIGFALIFVAFAFFQPLVPALEATADAVMERASAVPGRLRACITCACCRKPAEPVPEKDGVGATPTKRLSDAARTARLSELSRSARLSSAARLAQATRTARLSAATRAVHAPEDATEHAHDDAAAAHHHKKFEEHRVVGIVHADAAASHQMEANVAFAAGAAGAFMNGGDDDEDGGGVTLALNNVEGQLDFLDLLGEMVEKLQKMGKIIINFYQIVSTFLRSLDVPWPAAFGSAMARVSVINLNLVQLPKSACLNPSPNYYKIFNGYTLGMVAATLVMALIWALGVHVIAPLSLRRMSADERAIRTARFSSTVLSRALLLLYLIYPGVSVSIFSIFSCTHLESGVSYLDADFNIVCYDALHWRYIAAAIVWLFVVPIGVPAFFIWLLRRFKVPQMAQLLSDNAWLREIVKLGWQDGLVQPGSMDAAKVTVDDIGDAHLEALYAYFLHDAEVDEAAEILAGTRPGFVEEPPAEASPPTGCFAPLLRAAGAARAWGERMAAKRRGAALAHLSAAAARRAKLLAELLAWCPTSGRVATPPVVQWEEPTVEDEPEAEATKKDEQPASKIAHDDADDADADLQLSSEQLADPRRVLSKDLPELQERALAECGFLFAAYRANCWYWETVELLRKLALTSILALIAAGSAGQVVVGLLIAFAMLILNLHFKPYADETLNTVNSLAQMNLFFVLFVALLLKVDLDGQSSSGFFSFVVGALTVVPIALPVLLKLYIKLYGGLEARMLSADSSWS